MGVRKESVRKFLIGNHTKLRILSPYSNRMFACSHLLSVEKPACECYARRFIEKKNLGNMYVTKLQ